RRPSGRCVHRGSTPRNRRRDGWELGKVRTSGTPGEGGKGARETGEGRRRGPTSRRRPQLTMPARPAHSASSMPIQRQYLRKLLPNPSISGMTSTELLSTSRPTALSAARASGTAPSRPPARRTGRRAPAVAGSRYAPRVPSSSSLPPASMVWRVLAVLGCVAVLSVGGLTRSNDLFPFGVLDQFSTGTDPDGQVVSTCLQGIRGSGERVEIPFGQRSVGIERADVENNLPAIEADPQLLAPLAAEYERRHPGQAPLRALVLCQRVTQLQDGAAHGEPELVEIARWEAP